MRIPIHHRVTCGSREVQSCLNAEHRIMRDYECAEMLYGLRFSSLPPKSPTGD